MQGLCTLLRWDMPRSRRVATLHRSNSLTPPSWVGTSQPILLDYSFPAFAHPVPASNGNQITHVRSQDATLRDRTGGNLPFSRDVWLTPLLQFQARAGSPAMQPGGTSVDPMKKRGR